MSGFYATKHKRIRYIGNIIEHRKELDKAMVQSGAMEKGGNIEEVKLEYAKQDIALLEKEGDMSITDTKHGVLHGSYENGVFEFNGSDFKNLFRGNKEDAIEFVKNSFQVEEQEEEENIEQEDITIYYVKGNSVVTNISTTPQGAEKAKEKHDKNFSDKYGIGHIFKLNVPKSEWEGEKIKVSNAREWEAKYKSNTNKKGVAKVDDNTISNLSNKYEESVNENLLMVGFDVANLTEQQKDLIVQPKDAPENYYMDGEVTPEQAFEIWKKRLNASGFNAKDVQRAVDFNFKYNGGKVDSLIQSKEHRNQ